MKRLSREKIALIIFALLVVLGGSALVSYMTGLGHSFNVAASNIDRVAGDLDNYTALVYDGTAEKKKALNEAGLDSLAQEGMNKTLELGQDQTLSENESSDEFSAADVAQTATEENDTSQKMVTVSQVRNSFLKKNASVVELDLSNPEVYVSPTVIRAGKYRFGVLCINEASALPNYVKKRINYYQSIDVDFVVAVVDNLSRVNQFDGIDIVISTQEEGLKPVGVSSNGVFFNDAALQGEVGTILISPSKVISAKDVSEV